MARPQKRLEDIKFDGWAQLDALIMWANKTYCCEVLSVNEKTLTARIQEKYGLSFYDYKDQKKEAMRVNLRKKQYDVAMAGNVSMLIWLGKNELNQTDRQEVEQKTEERRIVEVRKSSE